jgi:hypothetical protein
MACTQAESFSREKSAQGRLLFIGKILAVYLNKVHPLWGDMASEPVASHRKSRLILTVDDGKRSHDYGTSTDNSELRQI